MENTRVNHTSRTKYKRYDEAFKRQARTSDFTIVPERGQSMVLAYSEGDANMRFTDDKLS